MGFTKATIEKIIAAVQAGYTCAEVAETLGVNESTIRSIVNR